MKNWLSPNLKKILEGTFDLFTNTPFYPTSLSIYVLVIYKNELTIVLL